MAIQPAGLAPALVNAIAAADTGRRRLSRTTAIAVAVSVAAHVAVGFYVYEARYAAPAAALPPDPTITTTFAPDLVIRKPPPRRAPPPPHVLAARAPHALAGPAQATAPFAPLVAKLIDPAPPRLSPVLPTIPADPPPAPPSVITSPDWLTRPGPNEFTRFYPQPALDRNASGMATLACTVSASGAVRDCQVAAETPKGLGFGDAAKKLAPYFKLRPQMRDGTPVDGASIRIPIRFTLAS